MTEETAPASVSGMRWYATVQVAVFANPDDYQQCCIGEREADGAGEVAQTLLDTHPDTAGTKYRVLVWANAERTGPVWTYSRNSASRFNPYTGETVDVDQLPFHELTDESDPKTNPILTPAAQAMRDAADAETAEGLAQAETVNGIRGTLQRNEYGGYVFIVSAEEELAAISAMAAQFDGAGCPDKSVIRLALERQLTGAAQSLQHAIAAAEQYAADSGHGLPWHYHEPALTSVSIAAAAYQAAFMYWKTYS
jgi:hypothetical protein